jgi:hypothetical protein
MQSPGLFGRVLDQNCSAEAAKLDVNARMAGMPQERSVEMSTYLVLLLCLCKEVGVAAKRLWLQRKSTGRAMSDAHESRLLKGFGPL